MNKKLPGKDIFEESECLSETVLEGYLHNSLSADEKYSAEKHLVDCELCADALEGLSHIKNHDKIPQLKKEIRSRFSEKKENRYWRAAASVAVIIGVGSALWYFNSEEIQPEQIASVEYSLPERTESFMSDGSSVSEEKNKTETESTQQNMPAEKTITQSQPRKKQVEESDKSFMKYEDEPAVAEDVKTNFEQAVASSPAAVKEVETLSSRNEIADGNITVTGASSKKSTVKSRYKNLKTPAAEKAESPVQSDKIMSLEIINDSPAKDNQVKLWLKTGKDFYKSNQQDSALIYFNKVELSAENEDVKAEAKYYSGLTYLAKNEPDKAKKIFEELASGKNKFRKDAEKHLLKIK